MSSPLIPKCTEQAVRTLTPRTVQTFKYPASPQSLFPPISTASFQQYTSKPPYSPTHSPYAPSNGPSPATAAKSFSTGTVPGRYVELQVHSPVVEGDQEVSDEEINVTPSLLWPFKGVNLYKSYDPSVNEQSPFETSQGSPFLTSRYPVTSQACDALIQSPCRKESYRMQRRQLYRQHLGDDALRPPSAPPVRKLAVSSFMEAAAQNNRSHSVDERVKTPVSAKTPKLGRGGFGSVYVGWYSGRMCAIKQLHGSHATTMSLRSELNAFRLDHPNIVKILTFTCHPTYTQVVFEYVGASNLQQQLDRSEEPLSSARKVQYSYQIGDALRYCHKNGVLHLDLKPANVLLTDDDQCKLGDFGCSQFLKAGEDSAIIASNNHGNAAGTLCYRAPELLRGGAATTKADVYAYGILLWQLLVRQMPYAGMEAHTIVFCVVARQMRPRLNDTNVLQTSNDRFLWCLAQKCWSMEMSKRPSFEDICAWLLDY